MALAPITLISPPESFLQGASAVPSSGRIDISSLVAQGYTRYKIGIDTTAYVPTDQISAQFIFTGDNGTTAVFGGGIVTNGGPHFEPDGTTPLWPSLSALLPAAGPNGLKVQATVTVPRAGQLRARVTVDQPL